MAALAEFFPHFQLQLRRLREFSSAKFSSSLSARLADALSPDARFSSIVRSVQDAITNDYEAKVADAASVAQISGT